MKTILQRLCWLCLALPVTQTSFSQANTALSNLAAATSINADLLPSADNTRSFGSAVKGWKILYVNSAIYLGGSKFISFGSSVTLRNTAVGYNALNLNSSGTFNTAYGASAMQNNTTGFGNVAIGYSALYANTTGSSNIAIGIRSLNSNLVSKSLIAIGDSAMFKTNGGQGFNIAIGAKALYSNTTGDHNTAIGSASFYSNTTGRNNVGIGSSALYNNTNGKENNALGHAALLLNTTGSSNIAIGAFSMNNNTSGYSNIAIGSRALNANRTNSHNIAIGDSTLQNSSAFVESIAIGTKALQSNTVGANNIALGSYAMNKNTTGAGGVAVGQYSMYYNTTGVGNTAVGEYSLFVNTSGQENTAVGEAALEDNQTGHRNVAVGISAGSLNDGMSYTTAIGPYARAGGNGVTNSMALGYAASVYNSNSVLIGNSSVTSIGGTVDFSVVSDGRFKKDVNADVPGLAFIRELRPVTYHYDVHSLDNHSRQGLGSKAQAKDAGRAAEDEIAMRTKEKILYTGFIAQEVEQAAAKNNYEFSGLHKPQNDNDTYSLSYSGFVPPIVKGMQELSAKNDSLKASNDSLKSSVDSLRQNVDSLRAQMARIEAMFQPGYPGAVSLTGASLDQNNPNPFNGSTLIRYSLPQRFGRAKLQITDASGRVIKSVVVYGSGRGSLTVNASGLAAGIYNYTLYVDEQMVETKQMILSK